MRSVLAAVLLASLLAGCAEPVFVPDAGPGAPGYTEQVAPPPPDVEVTRAEAGKPLAAGGAIDSVVRGEGTFTIIGWAFLAPDAPRGLLQLVLSTGSTSDVLEVESLPRADVVVATGKDALVWSGFSVTVSGSLPVDAGVCVLSRSRRGDFRLGGSDEALCPA